MRNLSSQNNSPRPSRASRFFEDVKVLKAGWWFLVFVSLVFFGLGQYFFLKSGIYALGLILILVSFLLGGWVATLEKKEVPWFYALGLPASVLVTGYYVRACLLPNPQWQYLLLAAVGWVWLLTLYGRRWFKQRTVIFGLAVLLAIAIVYFLKYYAAQVSFDEEAFIWEGWSMFRGGVPYKDFFELRPIGIFVVNALGIFSFGLSYYRILTICFIIPSVILFYFVQIKLKVHPWLGFALALHYLFILFLPEFHDQVLNDSETYGLIFAVMGLAAALWPSPVKKLPWRQFLAGFCLGISVLFKEPFLWVTLGILLAVFVYYYQEKVPERTSRIAGLVCGGATAALLTVLYLKLSGGFAGYIKNIEICLRYQKEYAASLGRFNSGTLQDNLRADIAQLRSHYFNFAFLYPLIPFYLAFLWKNKLKPVTWASFISIALGGYAISMGHTFWAHLYLMGTAGLLLPALLGAQALTELIQKINLKWITWSAVGLALLLAFMQNQAGLMRDFRTVYGKANYQVPENVQKAVDQHSQENDYILVTGHPVLYPFLNRRHSFNAAGLMLDNCLGYFNNGNIAKTLEESRLELESKKPKVIYIVDDSSYLKDRQHMWIDKLIMPFILKNGYQKIDDHLYYLPDN